MLGGGAGYFRQAALPLPWDLEGLSFANTTASLQAATSLPLLGLFSEHDLPWEIDRQPRRVPSLRQMASRAAELLQANYPHPQP
jgi:alkaline phosphatase